MTGNINSLVLFDHSKFQYNKACEEEAVCVDRLVRSPLGQTGQVNFNMINVNKCFHCPLLLVDSILIKRIGC